MLFDRPSYPDQRMMFVFQVAWSKDLSSFEGKTFTICVSFANWVRIENGGFSEISMGF